MNLKSISNIELTNRLNKLVRTERKITHLILEHIIEFESRKLYAEHGYPNMFTYLTKKLGYGEDSAYRRLQAARVLKRLPEVANKIECGNLNLTQLTQVEKCLNADKRQGILKSSQDTRQILEKLENCTGYETKKILAIEFNQPLQTQTHISPQKDDSVRLEITLTHEQFKELKTAQSLLSHSCHSADLGDVITTLAHKFNQTKLGNNKSVPISLESKIPKDIDSLIPAKLITGTVAEKQIDPVVVQEQRKMIISKSKSVTQGFLAARKLKRKYISMQIKRNLFKQAKYSCEYTSFNGQRCNSQYQLQIDHIQPIALGGTDSVENLRILCRTHNTFEAERFGLQRKKLASIKCELGMTSKSCEG